MIEHDITYKWSYGSAQITTLRQITADNAGILDLALATATYNSPALFALTRSKVQSIFLTSDQPVTLRAGGTNAVQSVTITGSPAGGSFTLTFGAQTTAAIPYNATATQVQTALNLLSSILAGGVACTGGPLPGTLVYVAFQGLNAVQVVTAMTHTDGLTGGSSPAVAIATTTAGVAPDTTFSLLAGVPLVWDASAYFAQPFAADVTTVRVTNTSGSGANVKLRTLSSA